MRAAGEMAAVDGTGDDGAVKPVMPEPLSTFPQLAAPTSAPLSFLGLCYFFLGRHDAAHKRLELLNGGEVRRVVRYSTFHAAFEVALRVHGYGSRKYAEEKLKVLNQQLLAVFFRTTRSCERCKNQNN